MMSLMVLVRLLFLSEVFSVVTFRGEPFNVIFFWGGGGDEGVEDLISARIFPTLIKKKQTFFFSRKAVHDIELNEHDFFSCFRCRRFFFSKCSTLPLPPPPLKMFELPAPYLEVSINLNTLGQHQQQ